MKKLTLAQMEALLHALDAAPIRPEDDTQVFYAAMAKLRSGVEYARNAHEIKKRKEVEAHDTH